MHPQTMTTFQPPGAVISIADYERIFRVIHGVLLNEQGGSPYHACLYFGVIGALILKTHHGMDAKAVVGAAAYRLNQAEGDLIIIGEGTPLGVRSSPAAFHCWVQTDDHIVDFQAPMFKEIGNPQLPGLVTARRMMQRRIDAGGPSLESLAVSGTHWHEANADLTASKLTSFSAFAVNRDVAEICNQWYKPTPRDMRRAVSITDQDGEVRSVPVSPLRIDGAW